MRSKSALAWIIRGCGFTSIMAISLLSILVVGDLVIRNLELANWPWLNEITEYLLTISTFAGAPWVLHHHGHVNIDVVLRLASPRLKHRLVWFADCIGGLISIILLVVGIQVAIDSYQVGSMVFNNLVFPEWYMMVPVILCFGVITLEFLDRVFNRELAS